MDWGSFKEVKLKIKLNPLKNGYQACWEIPSGDPPTKRLFDVQKYELEKF